MWHSWKFWQCLVSSAFFRALDFFSQYRGLSQVPHECHTAGLTLRFTPVSPFFFHFFLTIFILGWSASYYVSQVDLELTLMYVEPMQDLNLKPSCLGLPYTRVSIPRPDTFILLSEYCAFVLNQLVQNHVDLLALMKDLLSLFVNNGSLQPGCLNFFSDFPTLMYFQYSNGRFSSPWPGSCPWMRQQGNCGYLYYTSMCGAVVSVTQHEDGVPLILLIFWF